MRDFFASATPEDLFEALDARDWNVSAACAAFGDSDDRHGHGKEQPMSGCRREATVTGASATVPTNSGCSQGKYRRANEFTGDTSGRQGPPNSRISLWFDGVAEGLKGHYREALNPRRWGPSRRDSDYQRSAERPVRHAESTSAAASSAGAAANQWGLTSQGQGAASFIDMPSWSSLWHTNHGWKEGGFRRKWDKFRGGGFDRRARASPNQGASFNGRTFCSSSFSVGNYGPDSHRSSAGGLGGWGYSQARNPAVKRHRSNSSMPPHGGGGPGRVGIVNSGAGVVGQVEKTGALGGSDDAIVAVRQGQAIAMPATTSPESECSAMEVE